MALTFYTIHGDCLTSTFYNQNVRLLVTRWSVPENSIVTMTYIFVDPLQYELPRNCVRVMVFNNTFNNVSAISQKWDHHITTFIPTLKCLFRFYLVTSAHLTLTSHQPFSHRFYYVLCWRPSWIFWSRLYYSPSIGSSMEHSSQCGFQMVHSFQRRIIFRKKFPMNPVLNLSCGDDYLFGIFK
jgi:hypothetical protein